MPKRVSLPSMFAASMPSFWIVGLPAVSAAREANAPAKNRTDIAANTAQPCFTFPTMSAKV